VKRKSARRTLASVSFVTLASSCLLFARSAAADITLLKSEKGDGWEVYTNGRINAFFSWNRGDGQPVPPSDQVTGSPLYGFKLAGGTGLGDTFDSSEPVIGPTGNPVAVQGKVNSMRVRSGFVGNVLGIGIKRNFDATTKVTGYISIWSVVESEGHRKYFPNFADVREGYMKIEGPWGSFTGGKALTLFNRGATEADFLYLHGYGLGYPGGIDVVGPAAGLIGFGILGSTFSGGLVYATPSLAGIQLSAGVYDPASLTGSGLTRTGAVRPEFELTVDEPLGTAGKVHLFLNGAYQKLYRDHASDTPSETVQGFGAGGRVEVGPVHLAGGIHRGIGLGIFFALQPSDATYSDSSQLRDSEGFFAIGQLALGKVDINLGYGQTKVKSLASDLEPDPASAGGFPKFSLIKTQTGIAGAVVFHAADWLHFDADVMHADFKWTLNDRQQINFFNVGSTLTW
jgi:hypothetical protein